MIAPTQVCSNVSFFSEMSHSESDICALRFRDKWISSVKKSSSTWGPSGPTFCDNLEPTAFWKLSEYNWC